MSASLRSVWRVAGVGAWLLMSAPLSAADQSCPPWPYAARQAAQLREQLCSSNVHELEKYFGKRVADYEGGRIDAEALADSFGALAAPYPYDRLQGWLERYPNSYAANLATAVELLSRGFNVRGAAYVNNTTPAQLASAHALLERGEHYLNRSIPLSKRPFLSYYFLIDSGRYTVQSSHANRTTTPRPQLKAYMDKAIEIDGPAFLARREYMRSLQTRWGGSLEAMQAHLDASRNAKLSQSEFDYLRAMVIYEQAWIVNRLGKADEYLKLVMEANRVHEGSAYLLEIVTAMLRQKRYADLLPYADRALILAPGNVSLRRNRGIALFALERHAEAYKDFRVSAESGDAFSQNKVGYYLSMGIGVPQNKREGAQWFAKAAAAGDKDGMANLALAKAQGSI